MLNVIINNLQSTLRVESLQKGTTTYDFSQFVFCYFSLRLQKTECCKMHELLLPSQITDVTGSPHYTSRLAEWPELWWLYFSGQVGMKFGLRMKTLELTNLITAALLILWPSTSCFEDWTCCSLLYQRLFLSLCVCASVPFHHWLQTCFGRVHYCMSESPWMINKGLHFPPLSSLRSAILSPCVVSSGFRVTKTLLSFSLSSTLCTSLHLFAFHTQQQQGIMSRVCFKVKMKLT